MVEMLMARHELPADELALLAAIHEQPREPSHRFAYADWLAGHGEPDLAGLIRRQCKPTGPYALHLLKDGLRIEGRTWLHVGRWFRPLPRPLRYLSFHRGLPEAKLRPYMATLKTWDNLMERIHPRVRLHVSLMDDNDFEQRMRHPLMGRADDVLVFGRNQLDDAERAKPLSGAAARAIMESPFVGRFSHVEVAGDMDEEAAAVFRDHLPCRFTTSKVGRKRVPHSPKG